MKIYRIDGSTCKDFSKDVFISLNYFETQALAEKHLRNNLCGKTSMKLDGRPKRVLYHNDGDQYKGINYCVITEINVKTENT